MKIAVVFSGQGAQKPGMGRSLYEGDPAARAVMDKAPTEILRYCFEGSEEDLSRTDITQPCIYTVSMGAFAALENRLAGRAGIAMTAGFSLGEYSALTAAGVFGFDEGLSLVSDRGRWMEEAAEGRGGMCAVIGKLEKVLECVESAAESGMVLPVNYNCPGQTVVAGEHAALAAFESAASGAGLRVVRLKVSGPFHSPLMAPVADRLSARLEIMDLRAPSFPVYSNVTSAPMDPAELRSLISRQVMSPVRWETAVRGMLADGADCFLEVGVGSTLCGFLRRIDRSVPAFAIEDMESLDAAVSAVLEG